MQPEIQNFTTTSMEAVLALVAMESSHQHLLKTIITVNQGILVNLILVLCFSLVILFGMG